MTLNRNMPASSFRSLKHTEQYKCDNNSIVLELGRSGTGAPYPANLDMNLALPHSTKVALTSLVNVAWHPIGRSGFDHNRSI